MALCRYYFKRYFGCCLGHDSITLSEPCFTGWFYEDKSGIMQDDKAGSMRDCLFWGMKRRMGYNHGVIDKGVRADGDKERFNYILSYL